jgi:hypothetical protein
VEASHDRERATCSWSAPRRRASPGGDRPGERVKDYPQVSLRIPPPLKSQLYALSVLREKPQWRILIEAIACLMRDLSEADRRRVHDIARRSTR